MKNIVISGYFGFDNTGDEALLNATIREIKDNFIDCNIYVISHNAEKTKQMHDVNAIDRMDFNAISYIVSISDLVILGGGGLFQDNHKINIADLFSQSGYGIASYAIVPLIAKMHNKPVFYFAQGIGPLFSKESRSFVYFASELADFITVRDLESETLLKELCVSDDKILLTADPAIKLKLASEESINRIFLEENIPFSDNYICVNVRSWIDKSIEDSYKKAIAEALDKFAEQKDIFFLFVPFQISEYGDNDYSISKEIIKMMKNKNKCHILKNVYHPTETAKIISKSCFVLGMRYHSIIFAINSHIPFIAISYDQKVTSLVNETGLSAYCLDFNSIDPIILLNKLKLVLNELNSIKAKLTNTHEILVKRCGINYQILWQFLDNSIQSQFKTDIPKIVNFNRFLNFVYYQSELMYRQRKESDYKIEEKEKQIEGIKSELKEKGSKIYALENINVDLKSQLEEKNKNLNELQSLTADFKSQIEEISDEVLKLKETLKLEVENRDSEIENLEVIIRQMENSVSWRLGQLYGDFIPSDSKTTKLLRGGINNFLLSKNKDRKLIKNAVDVLQNEGMTGIVRRGAQKISHTQNAKFNPYDRLLSLKPIMVEIIEKDYPDIYDKIKFSVIVPVRNEGKNLANFFSSIEKQSAKPDELIIVEHGSTDNTVQEIKEYIGNYSGKTQVRLIQPTKKTLASQRNVGIREAKNEHILLLDLCDIPPNLFANLLGPIMEDPSIDLVSAIYYSKKGDNPYWHNKFIWNWSDLDFNNFIPSAKALSIKKETFEKVSGFPEFLNYTGEDTLFSIKYRKISRKWVINKTAFVFWDAASTEEKALKKMYSYGKGDGENGFGDFRFYEPLITSLHRGKQHFSDPSTESCFKGYLEGRSVRVKNLLEKKEIEGNFLILSGVPFTDSGGGQRGTQIALELMKKKYKVTFCNVYPSFEKENKVFLDIEHQLLELYNFEDFPIDDYIERHKPILDQTVILLEFPHPDFIPYINRLKSVNPKVRVIYDCIDNWDSTLGWIWYSKEKELEIIELSDVIIASAKTLLDRLKSMTNKEIYLIPNSVNTRLFNPSISYERPLDLPNNGRKIVIYTGALWGKWFDWSLLEHVAVNLPDVDFVIIGNIPDDNPDYIKLNNYKNINFLGLKNQFDIPKYLNHSDVCIIPFVYDREIIKYTNPLKVYEYLAMKKPVVSTFMDELVGLPGVFLSKNHDEFLSDLKNALNDSANNSNYGDFVYENSWAKRIDDLGKIIELQKK